MRQETLRRLISLGLLILLLLVFGFASDKFFTPANIYNMLRECSLVGILAIGVTLVIITGGNDLSGGALMGVCCMVIAHFLHYTSLELGWVILLAFLMAVAGGLFNGFAVSSLRIPDFIATLSTKFVFVGLMYVLAIHDQYGGLTTVSIRDPVIKWFGGKIASGPFEGLYYCTIAFVALASMAQFLLKRTQLGINLYAIGANRNSAEISGISFVRTKMAAFLISGVCAFVAALFFIGKTRTAEAGGGVGYELKAISATVIGGCAFSGGRGDIVGTVIGVLFMRVLENGILKFGFPTQTQQLLTGIVIVLMLIFDAFYNEFMTERTRRRGAALREVAVVK
ncbi:ABC transporter permease [Bacillota bacterium Meth-B3]